MKKRADRRKVLLRVRMSVGGSWVDACIVNVSSRGLGLQTSRPPPRGTYVEIHKGRQVIVARVIWANGHKFGVCAQDSIDLELIAAVDLPGARRSTNRSTQATLPNWKPLPKRFDVKADRSRAFSRIMEFAALGVAITFAAAFLFQALQGALVEPFERVLSAV